MPGRRSLWSGCSANISIIVREEGSGARAVFEQFLYEHGYSSSGFRKRSAISSFKLIEKTVGEDRGISFVYGSIAKNNKTLATFRIEGARISHEFNYVFLKNSQVSELLTLLE